MYKMNEKIDRISGIPNPKCLLRNNTAGLIHSLFLSITSWLCFGLNFHNFFALCETKSTKTFITLHQYLN